MHKKRKFALVHCILLSIALLFLGKISCDSFVNYMGWDDVFTYQRGR